MSLQPIQTEGGSFVERIRAEVRALAFEPLDEAACCELDASIQAANRDAAIEGFSETPDLQALHAMLIAERAPEDVHRWATRRFLELKYAGGASLADRVFADTPH